MTQTTPRPANDAPALDENAELGFGAMLVAETADGSYGPVSTVSTIREAREIAAQNFRTRVRELEAGNDPICPDRYVVWSQSFAGYRIICTIQPS